MGGEMRWKRALTIVDYGETLGCRKFFATAVVAEYWWHSSGGKAVVSLSQ